MAFFINFLIRLLTNRSPIGRCRFAMIRRVAERYFTRPWRDGSRVRIVLPVKPMPPLYLHGPIASFAARIARVRFATLTAVEASALPRSSCKRRIGGGARAFP